MILDGKVVRDTHIVRIKEQLAQYKQKPTLAIIQVGDRPDSIIYIGQKQKWAREVGMNVVLKRFPEDANERDIIDQIHSFNTDKNINGIVVQLPLPERMSPRSFIEAIDPKKDVDGLTDENQEKLRHGDISGFVPATARGIFSLLKQCAIDISGKKVVVLGRSRLVGGPIAELARAKGAEVIVCHRETPNIAELAHGADILISATGVAGLVTKNFVKPGAVVIDVGINEVSSSNTHLEEEISTKKFVGDVAYDEVKDIASAITPVPGGVGPMTVVSLLENVVEAAEHRV